MWKFGKRITESKLGDGPFVQRAATIDHAIQAQCTALEIGRAATIQRVSELNYTKKYVYGAFLVACPVPKTDIEKVFRTKLHEQAYASFYRSYFRDTRDLHPEFWEIETELRKNPDEPHVVDGITDGYLAIRKKTPQRLLLRMMDIFINPM